MQKEKELSMDAGVYLRRLSSKRDREGIACLLRDFLKACYRIPDSHTFHEIAVTIKRREIADEAKQKIVELCSRLDSLEYRPNKPSKNEIRDIKRKMSEILRLDTPSNEKHPSKKGWIQKKMEGSKEVQSRIEKEQQNIARSLEKKAEKKVQFDAKDNELEEMRKFISVSKGLNISAAQIRKELQEMGFANAKVEKALRS